HLPREPAGEGAEAREVLGAGPSCLDTRLRTALIGGFPGASVVVRSLAQLARIGCSLAHPVASPRAQPGRHIRLTGRTLRAARSATFARSRAMRIISFALMAAALLAPASTFGASLKPWVGLNGSWGTYSMSDMNDKVGVINSAIAGSGLSMTEIHNGFGF